MSDPNILISEIRELIVSARKSVASGVNLVQLLTNFEIGRRIVENEQAGAERAEYGEQIIRELAERLTFEFGRGFSKTNLELMRRFYLAYQERSSSIFQTLSEKLGVPFKSMPNADSYRGSPIAQTLSGQFTGSSIRQTVSGELSDHSKRQTVSGFLDPFKSASSAAPFTLNWSHYVFLMGIKDPAERSFYEIEATSQDWSMRELKRQFNTSLYERLALSRDKEGIRQLASEGQIVSKPEDVLKEPLVLEFLGIENRARFSESDLESAIIAKIEAFLLELGKGFLFESSQRRFTFDEEHFFVDLVFYNRLLRCYVLIDLKIGKLTHQDLGQMQMYVNYFDRHVKLAEERSTIGIILCKKKNDALVEITLPADAQIHAREYSLYLPSKEELRQQLVEWVVEEEGFEWG